MNQPPPMSMPQMGGPVGGPGAQNVGTPSSRPIDHGDMTVKLNTAIYDYLLRNELYSVAKELHNSVHIETKQPKQSPNQRGAQQTNGMDDGTDIDSKDPGLLKKPDDLPLPHNLGGDGPFLQDWWCQFWEMWSAHRNPKPPNTTGQYIMQQRNLHASRMAVMNNLNQANANMRMNPMMQQNGMMANDLKRQAMQNPRNLYVHLLSAIPLPALC
jgi:hypothetical protein